MKIKSLIGAVVLSCFITAPITAYNLGGSNANISANYTSAFEFNPAFISAWQQEAASVFGTGLAYQSDEESFVSGFTAPAYAIVDPGYGGGLGLSMKYRQIDANTSRRFGDQTLSTMNAGINYAQQIGIAAIGAGVDAYNISARFGKANLATTSFLPKFGFLVNPGRATFAASYSPGQSSNLIETGPYFGFGLGFRDRSGSIIGFESIHQTLNGDVIENYLGSSFRFNMNEQAALTARLGIFLEADTLVTSVGFDFNPGPGVISFIADRQRAFFGTNYYDVYGVGISYTHHLKAGRRAPRVKPKGIPIKGVTSNDTGSPRKNA